MMCLSVCRNRKMMRPQDDDSMKIVLVETQDDDNDDVSVETTR
jgi:hypothetical protein